MEYPKIRNVEAIPMRVRGQAMVCLRDPANFSQDVLLVPERVFFIISLFDGNNSLLDIQAAYMRRFGDMLFSHDLDQIIFQLDSKRFLDGVSFEQHKKDLEDAYRTSTVRASFHAGKAYESDPAKLREQIKGYFLSTEGPGQLPGPVVPGKRTKAVAAPHIDFSRGGPCFAWAYKEVAESEPPDLFVILGTNHTNATNHIIPAKKDFETPLGTVKTDVELVASFMEKAGIDCGEDELIHRTEHTIEFQAVWLQYLYRGVTDFSILPLLCSSFQQFIQDGLDPVQSSVYGKLIDALRQVLRESGKTFCLIASADLAHVGPRFGDRNPVSAADLESLRSADMTMLEGVMKLNPAELFGHIHREGDARKICGLPPLYALLQLTDAKEGKLLNYGQFPDSSGTVTFASAAFR